MTNNKLNPNWVTGFTDAEGCFMINITKRGTNKSEWQIRPCFQIKLYIKHKYLLLKIRSFFSEVGIIVTNYNYNFAVYAIHSLNDIRNIIIPHFKNYPLISQKYGDFIIVNNIVELMNKGEHLNKKGIIKIITLKSVLNKGLSYNLKIYFPDIVKTNKVKKPNANIFINIYYNWIAGFFSGDGCFSISIYKSDNHKIGYSNTANYIYSTFKRWSFV